MHWKIRRDPFLSLVAERHGEEMVYKAGFFLDEDTEDASLDDVDWPCTPRPRLLARGKTPTNKPVILLATGAFNPIHEGHVAMMDRARQAAETAGFDVVGGYLSPGHDAYLKLKCGPAAVPASVRLSQCAERAAAGSGSETLARKENERAVDKADPNAWLSVDPWEALCRRVSVNYTDVAARLRAYARRHFDPRIEVMYVCGADNARFAFAFVEDGGCIVVGRPGAEGEAATWHEKLRGHPKILWADGDHPAASRAIRGTRAWLDEDRKKRLVVRLEDARAVRTLGLSPAVLAEFQRELIACISEHATVRTVPIEDVRDDDATISLDAMLPTKHVLAISRLFAIGGFSSHGHVPRPGSDSFEDQLARIPSGKYTLRDDDRMTGGTLEAVRALLPRRIEITKTELALERDDDEEVVDSRDFLLGADEGGLVIELPQSAGRVGRAPYILPYVDPFVRASVRPDRVNAFSISIWSLNERLFRGTGRTVRDLPAPTRRTFAFLGEERPLEDVCRFHLDRLRRFCS